MIFGADAATSAPGLGDGRGHHVEDGQPGLLGLHERLGQDVEGQPVDLGVELQCGHHVTRAGHLEVHVAERVLGTEDVGEGHVLATVVDEAHGDSGDRGLEGHTGGHQRQGRAADRRHRRRTVGRQHVGHQAEGVGEVLLVGDDGQEGPLGQQAVADLAALRAPHEAGLAGREGREVVVVHVPLRLHRGDGVEQLVHPGHAQGRDVEHLGLAALEQRRAVGRREEVDLGGQRADVGGGAPVDAEALLDDPLADQLLGQSPDGGLDLALAAGELVGQLGQDRLGDLGQAGVALGLRGQHVGGGQTGVPISSTRANTSSP